MQQISSLPAPKGLILPYKGITPRVADGVFLAPNSVVVGDVEIGERSSLWYNVVVRADVGLIKIGKGTNLQDGTVVHVTGGQFDTHIGDDVLVGHLCMIHGCVLEDRAFIGMKATILDGARVETDAMVAAGAVVTPNKVVKSGELWGGAPAKKMRDMEPEEIIRRRRSAPNYAINAAEHINSLRHT
jgi:carbonic anhydrase/acetyltransferase-like protein (isoleucine patch superfamily)